MRVQLPSCALIRIDKMEIWKQCVGFSDYQVSSYGQIVSVKGNKRKILKPFPFKKTEPHLAVDLMIRGKRHRRAVHFLVLRAFTGPRPFPEAEARHLDGDATNNHADNLAWSSAQVNQADRVTHGTDIRGEKSPNCKLTSEQVRQIRERRAKGEPAKSIAKDYPIKGHEYVYQLCYNRTRKYDGR